ncbi:MAG: hypothetical protein FJZ09_02065 [Candidatus Omnitrophica bacterium]|nr:hypothetical protein [Candidatus Omnitrophota bacterium]
MLCLRGRRKSFSLVLSLLLAGSLFQAGGCGYTTRSAISKEYSTIYITPFVNKVDITQESYSQNKYRIYRPTIESDITKVVIDRFLVDGNLKPLREDSADLILKGELTEYRRDPLRYDDNDNVTEYRINLVVNISLYDRKNDKLLWEENGFTGDYSYFTTGNLAVPEEVAVNNALDDLARRIVERAVEQW